MSSAATNTNLIRIVKDPVILVEENGVVIDLHIHEDSDPAILDLDLLGKKIQNFEFLRDVRDSINHCLKTEEPSTTYFSYVYGGQLKHYEVLIEYHSQGQVLAMIKEVTKKKQRENELLDYADLIQTIYEGTASWTGRDYLDHLTIQLAKALKSDCTAIFLLDKTRKKLETVSICMEGVISKNVTGNKEGSPFDSIVSEGLLEIKSGFDSLYPNFFLLGDQPVTGFVGVPVFYNQFVNKPIGIMAAMYF